MEPSAQSPSVCRNGEGPLSPDNMVHSYISHMLLEDNIDDQILCQYYDHPELLQTQQALAHILSSPSSTAKNSIINNGSSEGTESLLHGSSGDPTTVSLGFDMGADVVGLLQMQQAVAHVISSPSASTKNSSINKGNSEGSEGLLHGSSGDPTRVSFGFDKGADVVGAFLKGMEEGRKFLPRNNKGADVVGAFFKGMQEGRQFLPRGDSLLKDDHMNQKLRESSDQRGFKKRCNRCEHLEEVGRCNKCEQEVARTSKGMMMMKGPEEIGMQIFEDMSLCGYETFVRDMEKLRITMNNKVVKNNRKGCSKLARDLVDLHTLLIHCAQAVDTTNLKIAVDLLKQIKQHASATGDATQRLALCFSKGLEARLVGTGSQVSKLLMAEQPSAVEFRKAYSLYTAACSFNKVAHIFSTRSIMQAMVGKNRLHIVDYGAMNYEFQWADLIRLLANRNREGDPPEVKITAISGYQPRSCPSEWIEEQEHRLNLCASEFGMPFTFRAITTKREEVSIENLNLDEDEVLVVNDIFNLSSLVSESAFFGNSDFSPRDTVLNNIRKMKPNIFIQSILNCSHGTSFLSRFREALFCYSALFDMLDTIVPRDSEQRLVLEQGMLGRWVLNAIACDGVDLIDRPEKYRRWQVRNRQAGLRQLPLERDIVKELKDKVKKHHHKNFLLSEDDQWLLQGWKGRVLFAHSTWVADDTSSE